MEQFVFDVRIVLVPGNGPWVKMGQPAEEKGTTEFCTAGTGQRAGRKKEGRDEAARSDSSFKVQLVQGPK
jgi:hypothetical protein